MKVGDTSAAYIAQSADQQCQLSSHQLSVGGGLQKGILGAACPVHHYDVVVVLKRNEFELKRSQQRAVVVGDFI